MFLVAAVLFGLFAIPLFLVVREPGRRRTPQSALREAIAALGAAADDDRARPDGAGPGRFLVGRFFYSDAVNTIIVVMSVVADRGDGADRAPWPS